MNQEKVLMTLCLVLRGDEVLLGMKKRGFGAGRWNGFGGKLKEGETLDQAVVREVKEEAEITPLDLNEMGILDFHFKDEAKYLEVHIFRADSFSGEPIETEEMRPQWFRVDEIPFDQMWSDDSYWFPLLLSGKKFKGKFLFNKPADPEQASTVLDHRLDEIESLS